MLEKVEGRPKTTQVHTNTTPLPTPWANMQARASHETTSGNATLMWLVHATSSGHVRDGMCQSAKAEPAPAGSRYNVQTMRDDRYIRPEFSVTAEESLLKTQVLQNGIVWVNDLRSDLASSPAGYSVSGTVKTWCCARKVTLQDC